jgi:predicted dehydrogenase
MGLEHIANLKLSPEAELAAIADPVEASRGWARALIGREVPEFASVEAMLAGADLDAVIVASPNHTHARVLAPLFETSLHILCEKPLCSDLRDARSAAAQARAHKGVFWVGMEYRFMPPAARFIADVHAGRVGRLVMVSLREHRFPFLSKVGDWNRFAENTGGTLVEKCCHFFDLMRLITASEPVRVFASAAMDVNHRDERYDGRTPDIIDNAYVIVDFANGVRGLLDLSMFAEGSQNQEEICAVGDAAKLEVFVPSGELVFSPRTPLGAPKAVVREPIAVDAAALKAGTHHGATYFQQRAFLEAVLNGAPVAVTAEDGYRAVLMGAAAELSAREHRAVAIAELE